MRVGYTVRVILPYTYVPFCYLFMQSVRDWATRVRRAFRLVSEELHSVIGDRRRSGARAQIYCETRKIAISWSLDWTGNRRPANPVFVSVAHRLTWRLTLASPDSARRWIIVSGLISSLSSHLFLSSARGSCRGFIPLFLLFSECRITRESRIAERRGSNLMGRNVEHSDAGAPTGWKCTPLGD